MWEAASSAFDRLSGLFGRGYLMSGVLPVVAIGGANLAIAWWLLPGVRPILADHLLSSGAEDGWPWVGFVVTLALAGFIVASLNPGFRKLLEGRALPGPLRRYCHARQVQALAECEAELAGLERDVRTFRECAAPAGVGSWRQTLKEARRFGNDLVVSVDFFDPTAADSFESRYAALCSGIGQAKAGRLKGRYPQLPTLQLIKAQLEAALREQPADLGLALHEAHRELLACLDAAAAETESTSRQVYAQRKARFPVDPRNVAPTTMGNYGEVANDYVVNRYGLDLDLFLVRAQKILPAADEFQQLVEATKSRLDLSVALTILCGLTLFAWATVAFVYVPTLLPVVVLGVTGTVVTWGLYEIACENLRAYAEVSVAAVDLYRFDLAKALRLGLPANSRDERALWERFRRQGDPNADPLEYNHAP